MSEIHQDTDFQAMVEHLDKSVNDDNLDQIVFINDAVSKMIKEGKFSSCFLRENRESVERLCALIQSSQEKIVSLKLELKSIQKDMVNKKRVSKKYSEVGKL